MKALLGALFSLILTACASVDAPAAEQASPQPATATRAASEQNVEYRLGVSDRMRILVFNEPTLSGEFSVNSNGAIAFPLIGDVASQGRTTSEVAQEISQRLSSGYLRSPQVSIDVLTFRPIYILGEVNKPGTYPYVNGMTVLKAVATAEGFTYRANKARIFIKSEGEEQEKEYTVTSSTPVHPGDTIRIKERYF